MRFCGILAGVITVAAITLTKSTVAIMFPFLPTALQDVNVGMVALALNVVVMGVVSAVTQSKLALAPSGA
ncbi:MAG TPA: hypothetical protein VNW52_01925 [Burkholderiaceae bacterium]|nr:hypothetical protein [Burkholderiaceae bacterium]